MIMYVFSPFFTHAKKVVLEDGKKLHYLLQIEMYLEFNK